ncbi:hypothetical protein HYV85_00460 [Candidatus Woesearchaeota archaeon]|nr:hypothetical protein [Candidatus Woesearchaeota archaeon]
MDNEGDQSLPKEEEKRGNILSKLDIVRLSDSEKENTKIEQLRVTGRDITQKVVKLPEFSDEEFREVIEKLGFKCGEIEGTINSVIIENIPNEKTIEEERRIKELRNTLKVAQLNHIEKEWKNIDVQSEVIDLVSSSIARANQKFSIDRTTYFLYFKNILGSLIERRQDDFSLFDDDEISRIVNASLADAPEVAKAILEQALKDLIVKMRKLFLIFAYEELSVKIINYHMDQTELSKVHENKFVTVSGTNLRIFSFYDQHGKKYCVAIDAMTGDIVTFGLGKKTMTELDPLIHNIFIDRISFYVQQQFLQLLSLAMERVKSDLINNWAEGRNPNFEKYSLEELKAENEEMRKLSEMLYRQIINIVQKIDSNNRDYTQTILREKLRSLSRFFGGAINQDIYALLPLDMIDSSKDSMRKLNAANQAFFNFMQKIEKDYSLAIEAKSKGNLQSLKTIASNIKTKAFEYITDPNNFVMLGRTGFNQIKKIFGGN